MTENTDDRDIQELFEKVAGHFEGADGGVQEMFSMLVKVTLKYRDMLVHSGGVPLNVVETKGALDAFMEVMQTHKIPQNLDKRVHDLVVLWLEEIKLRTHH